MRRIGLAVVLTLSLLVPLAAERLQGLAVELAGLKVDVIVTHGVRAIQAVQGVTKVIPIVMAASPDPVGTV
jgi:ABC-type uncharacterized transport system substrate-binding protein